ncbi:MAG: DUF554 domain-containing protein [Anaerolineae bacterium]|nr:DUF554 domain-containing protein [Anaerolineae bacterium]
MWGTLLNALTVLLGSSTGLLIGNRLPQRVQESVMTGLGLVTLFVGFSNAGETGNIILPLLSLVIGALLGELLRLDLRLEQLAGWLQERVQREAASADATLAHERRARFIEGFITASLVFCVGPLTFVGSIQDGMGLASGFEQLAIKSTLDAFASMAFAASLGIGVLFSVFTVLGVQGGLALLGALAGEFMSDPMINEMTAVGGLILIGLGLSLLEIKKPRMVNFLPGLIVAPVLVGLATALGIDIYPL